VEEGVSKEVVELGELVVVDERPDLGWREMQVTTGECDMKVNKNESKSSSPSLVPDPRYLGRFGMVRRRQWEKDCKNSSYECGTKVDKTNPILTLGR